jgi:hypothetical protein
MDGGIEQNPAYGTAQPFDLQVEFRDRLAGDSGLTPHFTPTGSETLLVLKAKLRTNHS